MFPVQKLSSRLSTLGVLAVLLAGTGCARRQVITPAAAPRELEMTSHPSYTVEPPDIVQLDLLSAVPNPPYLLKPLDVLQVSADNLLPDRPLNGPVTVQADGTVQLGTYGEVFVSGKSVKDAKEAIQKHLSASVREPVVLVTLLQTQGMQQIRGPHLVRTDGTIGLGSYGSVTVVGLTIKQIKEAVEAHLSKHFQSPEVSVDVVGYNSRVYYVVFDYGGAGQQVVRQPITGNETVLDAIGQVGGLPVVTDGRDIRVTRRHAGCEPQVLPVDWKRIIDEGDTSTNYQLLPGDRVVVKALPVVAVDVRLSRFIAPIERVLSVVLLGSTTVNTIRTDPNLGFGVPQR